jgi:hypothetical protein
MLLGLAPPPTRSEPRHDRLAAMEALVQSVLRDPFGGGGTPKAPPPPQPASPATLEVAAMAALRGAYGHGPADRPGVLDAGLSALAFLGPLRRLALRALSGSAWEAYSIASDRASGVFWMTVPKTARPTLVAAPGVAIPPDFLAQAAAVVDQAGGLDVGQFDGGRRTYDASLGAAHEERDEDFALALEFADSLAERMTDAGPYFEAARRLVKLSTARRIVAGRAILSALEGLGADAPIILIAGSDDWRSLAYDLLDGGYGDAGLGVVHAGRSIESRLAFFRIAASFDVEASAEAEPPPDLAASLDAAAEAAEVAEPADSATALVVGDLRAPAEKRWAPTIIALLKRLSERETTMLAEPWSARAPAARIDGRLAALGLRQVEARPFARYDAVLLPCAAVRPRLVALATALGHRRGLAGFLLEAMRALTSDLPMGMAHGRRYEAWARRSPRRCFLVPAGSRFEATVAALACRRTNTPVIEVHTLLTSASSRYDPPLGSIVACIDSEQADLLAKVFALTRDKLAIVGLHAIDQLREKARARGGSATTRATVYYPTQGLPKLDASAIRLVLAADIESLGLQLVVSAHPSMPEWRRALLEKK